METKKNAYLQEVTGIFSCVVFCVYSWSMLVLAWTAPSLLLHYTAVDITAYTAYQLTFALIESVIVTTLISGLVFVIPLKHVRENLSVAGSLVVFSFAISSTIFKEFATTTSWIETMFSTSTDAANQAVIYLLAFTLLGLPVISITLTKNKKVTKVVANFLQNLTVLTGLEPIRITLPLGTRSSHRRNARKQDNFGISFPSG